MPRLETGMLDSAETPGNSVSPGEAVLTPSGHHTAASLWLNFNHRVVIIPVRCRAIIVCTFPDGILLRGVKGDVVS